MQSLFTKSSNYKDLTNINGGSVYLACFLARFSLLFPLRPQPCFKSSAVFKTWKQTEGRLLLPLLLCRISTGLLNGWLIEPRRTHYETQNRIEAF